MIYYHSRKIIAIKLLKSYTYPEPFHLYLKNYFAQNKKHGSKDRKAIASLCFGYFRIGLVAKALETEEAIDLSAWIFNLIPATLLSEKWQQRMNEADTKWESNVQKFEWVSKVTNCEKHPFYDIEVSPFFENHNQVTGIDHKPLNWIKNYGVSKNDLAELTPHLSILDAFSAGVFQLKSDSSAYQVQDLSSQIICNAIDIKEDSKVWDICGGSAGKTINLAKANKKSIFYHSDKRENTVINAKKRLKNYGLMRVQSAVYDAISDEPPVFHHSIAKEYFDVLVADVPCSGSGTWFSTPEHFVNFDYQTLSQFTVLQRKIIEKNLKYLKSGGTVYYITCSIFSQENEEFLNFAKNELALNLVKTTLVNGAEHQSNSMFMAELIKN